MHLQSLGRFVAAEIRHADGVPKEFNTIAIDDGIAMGHEGMMYSLLSLEVIADAVEYMANAYAIDALVCISNCDKITPAIDTIYVSGTKDATQDEIDAVEESACPTCGSCALMGTANSMNCLTEAIGMALPGNGTLVATHEDRKSLFVRAAHQIVAMAVSCPIRFVIKRDWKTPLE